MSFIDIGFLDKYDVSVHVSFLYLFFYFSDYVPENCTKELLDSDPCFTDSSRSHMSRMEMYRICTVSITLFSVIMDQRFKVLYFFVY